MKNGGDSNCHDGVVQSRHSEACRMHQCGVCDRVCGEGLWLESGQRRPDGTTACDNFVCMDCVTPVAMGNVPLAGNLRADRKRPSGLRIRTASRAS